MLLDVGSFSFIYEGWKTEYLSENVLHVMIFIVKAKFVNFYSTFESTGDAFT